MNKRCLEESCEWFFNERCVRKILPIYIYIYIYIYIIRKMNKSDKTNRNISFL